MQKLAEACTPLEHLFVELCMMEASLVVEPSFAAGRAVAVMVKLHSSNTHSFEALAQCIDSSVRHHLARDFVEYPYTIVDSGFQNYQTKLVVTAVALLYLNCWRITEEV